MAVTFLVGGVSALLACGDSDSGEGGSGGAGGEAATTVATTATKATQTVTTGTGTTQTVTTGGMFDCSNPTEITAADWAELSADGQVAVYAAVPMPDSGAADADRLGLEIYGPPDFDGDLTGMFDLTAAGDDNYATCSRCFRLVEDAEGQTPGKVFFQVGGTLNIDAASTQLDGTITATVTDLLLAEVTIEEGTFESTPVTGGACLHLATSTIEVVAPVVPANWTCDPTFYADGVCDCGCAAFDDLDCADMTVGVCEFCDGDGSCSMDACPGTIDPANNAVCTP